MSYFMTIAGPPIDVSGLEPLELVPADQAQDYIRDRAAALSALDVGLRFQGSHGGTQ